MVTVRDDVILSAVRSVPAALIRSGVQRVFNNRLRRAKGHVNHIILVSPWLSAFEGHPHSVEQLVGHINQYRIRTYIFTRPAATSLENAVIAKLELCQSAEIVVNPHLHAKVYACVGPPPYGFGIVSSANFTDTSSHLYEIGMLIVGMGAGAQIVEQLSDFALSYLRTRPESRVLKRMDLRRGAHGVR
jgi:hypothetical protein